MMPHRFGINTARTFIEVKSAVEKVVIAALKQQPETVEIIARRFART